MFSLSGLTPAPGFNSPLDLLHACHDRIMDQCAMLQKIIRHLPKHGCDVQVQEAAKAVLRYFDTAGQMHHQDEEQDLFPLLQATGNEQALALLQKYAAEHQHMDALWARLRKQLLNVVEQQSAELDLDLVEEFTMAYGKHVMHENTKLLPLAAKLLSTEQLEPMGQNMAERRKVAPA